MFANRVCMDNFVSYKNYFLISSPAMQDPRFAGTVIYLCEHTASGAMGILINRHGPMTLQTIFDRVGVACTEPRFEDIFIYDGGPVQIGRGFILHNTGPVYSSTMKISEEISLSTSKDVLEAIVAHENEPDKFLLALGYSGWDAGQLEGEIDMGDWLLAPAEAGIIFDTGIEDRYEAALALIGLNKDELASWTGGEVGHA